jgi:hypothetical protein
MRTLRSRRQVPKIARAVRIGNTLSLGRRRNPAPHCFMARARSQRPCFFRKFRLASIDSSERVTRETPCPHPSHPRRLSAFSALVHPKEPKQEQRGDETGKDRNRSKHPKSLYDRESAHHPFTPSSPKHIRHRRTPSQSLSHRATLPPTARCPCNQKWKPTSAV